MKHFSSFLFLIFMMVMVQPAHAFKKHRARGSLSVPQKKYTMDFIENKGQWTSEARYKTTLQDGVFFMTDNGFVYNFAAGSDTAGKDSKQSKEHFHAYKLSFEGCNKNVSYTAEDRRSYYHNYFIGNDRSKWAGNVGICGKVIQHNVYDGINVAVYSDGYHLKYDFLVAAGAQAAQIKLSYKGVSPGLTKDGDLRITTSVNEIIEQRPYCYQLINGRVKVVPAAYKLEAGFLTFEFPEGYDTSYALVIDPEVIFSTYSGASYIPPPSFYGYSGHYGHATTYDRSGKLYSSVMANSLGWPVTLGAYQAVPSTKRDIGINVFNANGASLAYATYYGGASNENALTMLTNDRNELIIAGSTRSEDLPMPIGSYDNTFNGAIVDPVDLGTDIFLARFSSDGTQLLNATYLGGSDNELVPTNLLMNVVGYGDLYGLNIISPIEITLDGSGNVWLISNTISTDFPVTGNAQQPNYAGGKTDMVLCQLSEDFSQLLYSSYLGSSGFDVGNAITINKSGNPVICGVTGGNNFPVTPGALLTSAAGGIADGFVAVIDPANGSIISASYLGTSLADQACMLQTDDSNNVYVVGRTSGNYPIFNSIVALPGSDVFIQKLDSTLSTSVASTLLGNPLSGSSRLIPTGFVLTKCGEIVFSGFSHSTPSNTLPVTNGAFDPVPKKFWHCTMASDFSVISHASFFGSPQIADFRHCGTSHYDPEGIIYQSLTSSTMATFPTTPGAWSPTTQIISPLTKSDVVSFKIGNTLIADFILDASVSDSGCAPYSIQPVNTSTGANTSTFVWDFGDGSPTETAFTPAPHTYTTPGTYMLTLYVFNDSICVKSDTAFMPITVIPPAVLPDITTYDTIICSTLQTLDIGVIINNPNPDFEILWTPPNGILSPADQDTITVDPLLNMVYYVTVTDDQMGLCRQTATDTVTITYVPNPLELHTQDTAVCQGSTFQVSATGNGAYSYLWTPSTGLSDSSLLEPVITVNQPANYMLKASHQGCPDMFLFLDVDMHYYPQVSLGPDKSYCAGTAVPLESVVSPFRSDYLYSWTPNTGNLSTPFEPNTYFLADTTGTYTLTVQTPIGCAGADNIHITVYPSVEGGITADTGYCPGGYIQLLATGGDTYTWAPSYGLSDTAIADPVASPETSTDYTVIITNRYHCSDTQDVSIQVYPNAILNMPDSVNVFPGEAYQLEPGTNCHYFSWFPPSGISATNVSNPVFDPEVRTRYFVTATTEHGCTVKDSIDILVRETVMDMPNAFAPASNNALFRPSIRGLAALKAFNIFNRWGNKVYSSTDINSGWDGSYNGQPQPLGVYVYYIEAVMDDGRIFTKQGNVTLLR